MEHTIINSWQLAMFTGFSLCVWCFVGVFSFISLFCCQGTLDRPDRVKWGLVMFFSILMVYALATSGLLDI